MRPDRSSRIFDDFQRQGRIVQAKRRDDIETHFWTYMDYLGGNLYENPYLCPAAQRNEIKKYLKELRDSRKGEVVDQAKQEGKLLYEFSRLVIEELEPGDFHHRLENLETLDGLDEETLLKMRKNVEPINKERAFRLIEIWSNNEFYKSSADSELEDIDTTIHAKLLWNVDQALEGCFSKSMSKLFHFLLNEEDQIELFVNGLPEHEAFFDFVEKHKQSLNQGEITNIATSGVKISLRRFLENFAKQFFLEIERIQKDSGKENGKQIATLRKQELEAYYRRQKVTLPKPDKEKKDFMKREVIRKQAHGERMSRQEEAFYKTIGDRIVLKRDELVPTAIYEKLLETLLPSFVITVTDDFKLCREA